MIICVTYAMVDLGIMDMKIGWGPRRHGCKAFLSAVPRSNTSDIVKSHFYISATCYSFVGRRNIRKHPMGPNVLPRVISKTMAPHWIGSALRKCLPFHVSSGKCNNLMP